MKMNRNRVIIIASVSIAFAILFGLTCCTTVKRDLVFEEKIQSFADASVPGSEMDLLNGNDLGGWSVYGAGAWSFVDGVVSVRCGLGYLATRCDSFQDLVLTLDARISAWGNSGVFYRAHHPGYFDRPWAYGYEVQIDHHNQKNPTGSLYNLQKAKQVLSKNNEWFTIEIVSQKDLQQVSVNGTLVASITDATYTKGFIALQAHDPWSVVEFRNIRVRIPEVMKEK